MLRSRVRSSRELTEENVGIAGIVVRRSRGRNGDDRISLLQFGTNRTRYNEQPS